MKLERHIDADRAAVIEKVMLEGAVAESIPPDKMRAIAEQLEKRVEQSKKQDPKRLQTGAEKKDLQAAKDAAAIAALLEIHAEFFKVLVARSGKDLIAACQRCVDKVHVAPPPAAADAPVAKPKYLAYSGTKEEKARRLLYRGQIFDMPAFNALLATPLPDMAAGTCLQLPGVRPAIRLYLCLCTY